jgi:Glu-tRNA(Gln) amidotransferase subunit E-like FAD-binding protein
VNVSVAGGRRVELKGVPSQRSLPRLVHNEAYRQLNLLRIRAELLRRGIPQMMFSAGDADPAWGSPLAVDARTILKKCEYPPLRDALDREDMVAAVRLPGFGDLLGHGTQPGIAFARELADRVQVIACLEARPFMISSVVSDYGLGPADWRHLRSALSTDAEDGVVVVWGPEADVDTAVREILIRAREAFDGVPSETRQAFADGTTGFERILPGADRMYPDTDTPPVVIPDAWVREVEARLPERPWQVEDRYVRLGLDPATAARTARAPWAALFEELSREGQPELMSALARALERTVPRALKKRRRVLPSAAAARACIDASERGELPGWALESALARVFAEEDAAAVISELAQSDAPVVFEKQVRAMLASTAELRSDRPEARMRWAMGKVMTPLRGRLEPRVVSERVASELASVASGALP